MNNNYSQKDKKIKIGNLTINSRIALAPMAGITDLPLRLMIRNYSKNCLLTTEMISSESLMQNIDHSKILAYRDEEHPIAFQISGHKPWMMAKAAKMLEDIGGADIIDINMGCPVKKVVCGGDGSALMRTPETAADIVKAVKDAVSLPVSVKFRLGYTANEMNFKEFAIKMQDAGADAMTIHCRTRSQMYSGQADWSFLNELKEVINVPVYVNGDIVDVESAHLALEQSGADGIAIGRGVLGRPDLIYRIEHYFKTGEVLPCPDIQQCLLWAKNHLDDEVRLRGEKNGVLFMRKFYPYYIRGLRNAAAYRGRLVEETEYLNQVMLLNRISEIEYSYV